MSDQRKNQRFDLKLPIELVRGGTDANGQVGETRNLSSGGVLFTTAGRLQKGDPIEYLVTLPSQDPESALQLRCMGKVVRVEDRPEADGITLRHPYSIAATMERHEFLRR